MKQGWSHLAWLFPYVQSECYSIMLALLSLLCWKFPSGFQVELLKASYLLSWVQEAETPPCFTWWIISSKFLLSWGFQSILRLLDLPGDELPYPLMRPAPGSFPGRALWALIPELQILTHAGSWWLNEHHPPLWPPRQGLGCAIHIASQI